MPELMKCYRRKTSALQERRERPLTQVGGIDEGAFAGTENQTIFLPLIASFINLH